MKTMYKPQYLKVALLVLISTFACNSCASPPTIEVQQVLFDGIAGVDGLDNPRQVQVSSDGRSVFVASADDDSLLILRLEEQLKPMQIFKSEYAKGGLALVGASALGMFNRGTSLAVVSFYSGALSLFRKEESSHFSFDKSFTDNLSYERVFGNTQDENEKDIYGLLGAYDVAISYDEKHLFVASYKSNGISVFDISEALHLTFNHHYTRAKSTGQGLGNPVSIAYSKLRDELIVAGFEGNSLSVLSKNTDGKLRLKQTIQNDADGVKDLINPQEIILSPDDKHLYVACPGSNAIVVFELRNNQYQYRQSVSDVDTSGLGLAGIGSMVLTDNGSRLFAAGEMGEGLLLFDVNKTGKLVFNRKFLFKGHKIEGVTSIAKTADEKMLLLTLGKRDALVLLTVD